MSVIDEMEHEKLLEAISLVERIQTRIVAESNNAAAPSMLGAFGESIKRRVEELEMHCDLPNRGEKEKKKAAKQLVAGYIAISESRLSVAEQRQYAEFLTKEYFTKSDFNQLEEFYSSAWERLSESGKAEMSERVWEGVRRGEYSFVELPDEVRKKEAELLYQKLVSGQELPANLKAIPEAERREFMAAVESGNQSRIDDVMSSDVFAKNVAVYPPSNDVLARKPQIEAEEVDSEAGFQKSSAVSNQPNSVETEGQKNTREEKTNQVSVEALPDLEGQFNPSQSLPRVNSPSEHSR